MRIGVLLVSLAVLATPALAGRAASEETTTKPSARPKLPTNLRGSISPQVPAQAAAQASPRNAPPPPPPIAPGPLALKPLIANATPLPGAVADTGQCRTDCAHTYYFCLSGEITADCSATWSQCQVNCSHPPPTIEP